MLWTGLYTGQCLFPLNLDSPLRAQAWGSSSQLALWSPAGLKGLLGADSPLLLQASGSTRMAPLPGSWKRGYGSQTNFSSVASCLWLALVFGTRDTGSRPPTLSLALGGLMYLDVALLLRPPFWNPLVKIRSERERGGIFGGMGQGPGDGA